MCARPLIIRAGKFTAAALILPIPVLGPFLYLLAVGVLESRVGSHRLWGSEQDATPTAHQVDRLKWILLVPLCCGICLGFPYGWVWWSTVHKYWLYLTALL